MIMMMLIDVYAEFDIDETESDVDDTESDVDEVESHSLVVVPLGPHFIELHCANNVTASAFASDLQVHVDEGLSCSFLRLLNIV